MVQGPGFKGEIPELRTPNARRDGVRGLTPAAMVRRFGKAPTSCRSGGIGRRAGLKIRCPQGRGGSSPLSGTYVVVISEKCVMVVSSDEIWWGDLLRLMHRQPAKWLV